jgi:hypothetical protein
VETNKPDARPINRRTTARKALRCAATVDLPREGARGVTLQDLSLEGLSVLTPRPIAPGTRCTTSFELPLAGGLRALALKTKVIYSSYTGPNAFKVGMSYTELDGASEDALAEFTRD